MPAFGVLDERQHLLFVGDIAFYRVTAYFLCSGPRPLQVQVGQDHLGCTLPSQAGAERATDAAGPASDHDDLA